MKYLLLGIASVLLIACNDSEKDSPENNTPFEEKKEAVTNVILVDNNFPAFESPVIPEVLEELGFCTNQDSLISDSLSKCSDQLFRVFPLNSDGDFSEGFILDARIGALKHSSSRSLIVIKNINGTYRQVNFLKGKLLELRQTDLDNVWLLVQYRIPGSGMKIAVRHEWNHNKLTYLPVDVEEINRNFVKEEYKDSINRVYLDNFGWGY